MGIQDEQRCGPSGVLHQRSSLGTLGIWETGGHLHSFDKGQEAEADSWAAGREDNEASQGGILNYDQREIGFCRQREKLSEHREAAVNPEPGRRHKF